MARFNAPAQPGCYLFKDASGTILYVGKAKNLRNRVASYFNNTPKASKTRLLVASIADAEFIVVNNETEALLLENRLIKQHRPRFNIDLKDDKRYAYLLLTDEPFPRLITTRNPKAKGRLFGPYTDGYARRDVQDICQRTYHIRTCTTLPKKVCLMHHLRRCDGPCEGRISQDDYAKNIAGAERVLRGDTTAVIATLEEQMKAASGEQRYELARHCRDAITSIKRLKQRQSVDKQRQYDQDAIGLATDGERTAICVMHVNKGVLSRKSEFIVDYSDDILSEFLAAYYDTHDVPNKIHLPASIDDADALTTWLSEQRGTNVTIDTPNAGAARDLVTMANKNAQLRVEDVHPGVIALRDALNLPQLPRIIDVFDISTLQGTNTVGAKVQFNNGRPHTPGYRKFIIKRAHAQDDTACMREVVGRQYRTAPEKTGAPDLIVIDGGPLQLAAAREALATTQPGIPLIALAKQHEEIYLPFATQPLRLPKNHPGLLLLRAARDAVHSFVIRFHRTRRGKAMIHSALDDIPGIGPATKAKLLVRFGSVEGIRAASIDELRDIVPERIARTVHARLKN